MFNQSGSRDLEPLRLSCPVDCYIFIKLTLYAQLPDLNDVSRNWKFCMLHKTAYKLRTMGHCDSCSFKSSTESTTDKRSVVSEKKTTSWRRSHCWRADGRSKSILALGGGTFFFCLLSTWLEGVRLSREDTSAAFKVVLEGLSSLGAKAK